jgi:hypothetical protein
MEIKKGLSKKVRGLADLGINQKDRRKIIQKTYICFRELKGFPEELEKLINDSKEKKESREEAYQSIRDGLSKYQEKLTEEAQMNQDFYNRDVMIW